MAITIWIWGAVATGFAPVAGAVATGFACLAAAWSTVSERRL